MRREIHPKINGYANEGRLAAQAQRRRNARALLAARAQRTDEEQLALIAQRPGESRRETARIMARMGGR